jgi:hypothetical protein
LAKKHPQINHGGMRTQADQCWGKPAKFKRWLACEQPSATANFTTLSGFGKGFLPFPKHAKQTL